MLLWTAVVAGAGPAAAGAGRMAPVHDRYEPGATATFVGYTAGLAPQEPFYAYLRRADDGSVAVLDDAGTYVGPLVVEETTHGGYLRLRVSLTFDVPENLPAGDYEVTYCDDPCTGRFLGDLMPGPVSIGADPPRRVVREWAPDEPQIVNLAADAVLVGPGFQTTAGELRAPATTVAPAPPAVAPQAPAGPPSPASGDDGAMAWPVPAALVLASGAGTALVLSRRQRAALRAGASRSPALTAADRAGGAFAGRG